MEAVETIRQTFLAGSSHGGPVRSQDATEELAKRRPRGDGQFGLGLSLERDARATGCRSMPPTSTVLSRTALVRRTIPTTYCPSLTNQARSGTSGGPFFGEPRAVRCYPDPRPR